MTNPKQVIKSRFSKSARRYNELCSIQNDLARELADRITLEAAHRVLDVGCGTGNLTSEILSRHPGIQVTGLDFSEAMISTARSTLSGAAWTVADGGHLPFKDKTLDAVVSSSSYQWMMDLPAAFCEARRVLKDGGQFHAVYFGRRTLHELFESLGAGALARGREDVFYIHRLPSETVTQDALDAAAFSSARMLVEKRTVYFRELWDLLKWLQGIGANSLAQKFFLGGEFLSHVEEHYREQYGSTHGIRATFEVFMVQAVK